MFDENNLYGTAIDPDKRGRHATLKSALDASFANLMMEKNPFFDTLADNWKKMFPDVPAVPGRTENGRIYLYVRNAATSYVVRPKLRAIAARLAALPDAPKNIDLRLEIHVDSVIRRSQSDYRNFRREANQ